MLANLKNTLTSFIYNIQVIDILDIAVAACILYFILEGIRNKISKRSLAGFSILVVIYTTARLTGMYLTELLIEIVFVVFIVGVVIVFQSDIRRFINRIGNWDYFNKSNFSSIDKVSDIITEAAADMASTKTGALMVIKGKDNWERLIHGGIALNGAITVPLIKSIFNPQGPGHDGAVLIQEDQITRFSVHLPLSTNLGKYSTGGTRHAAALGLSEQCDALVVVVSEERGVISVAQDGNITVLAESTELKKKLNKFLEQHYTSSKQTATRWWKKSNLRTVIGAVVLSLIFWLAFVYQPGTVYRTYQIPIEYRNVKKGESLQGNFPSNISITIYGSEQAFENFNPDNLVVSFDLGSADAKDGVMEISAKNINLPSDLKLYEATPEELILKKN